MPSSTSYQRFKVNISQHLHWQSFPPQDLYYIIFSILRISSQIQGDFLVALNPDRWEIL